MPRFFVEGISADRAVISGDDARHIVRSLRMSPGAELTVCDGKGRDFLCRIAVISGETVELDVLDSGPSSGESPVRVRLYQALPKGDKLEFIVQKAVELGVCEIIPVMTSRCISRPSIKAFEKRRQRLQRTAYEAAKQSGRGIIPQVLPLTDFEPALKEMSGAELAVLLYENSGAPLREALSGAPRTAALMVGSEGGFSAAEVSLAREMGISDASLGRRILRCETAPVCALSALFFYLGEF